MNQLPSVPEYFKTHVNSDIDLETTTSIPCPFHNEKHGKSFTYSTSKKVFRCWGGCHTGGGVIELHKLHMRIKTTEEAKASLYSLYSIPITHSLSFEQPEIKVNEEDIAFRVAYNRAISKAVTVEDWIELDYIMSKHPIDVNLLEAFGRR